MIQKNNNGKKLLRIALILLISAILLIFGLFGCNKQKSDDSDASVSDAEQKIAELLKGKLNDYQIVRAEGMDKTELRILLSFANVLKNNGADELKIVSDYEEIAPVIDNEIIVGETTRKDNVYFANDGVVLENEGYTVAIVENRLIFGYTDQKGMMDGLECLLFLCLDIEDERISEAFDLSLYERDIKRYSFENFSLKNQLTDKARLFGGDDMMFIGTAEPNAKVTLQLTKNLEVISEADTVTDADGVWKTNIVPDKSANALVVRIDGKLAEKYDDITFVDSVIEKPSNGMKVYINDIEVDVYENKAG